MQLRVWVRLRGTALKRIDLERRTEHVATCRLEDVEDVNEHVARRTCRPVITCAVTMHMARSCQSLRTLSICSSSFQPGLSLPLLISGTTECIALALHVGAVGPCLRTEMKMNEGE